MPRLLVVAYHFPPEPAAGALRPGYLAKYLPESGWEPVVLTRRLGTPERIACPIVTAPVLGEKLERWLRREPASGHAAGNGAPSPASTASVSPARALLRWLKQTMYFPDRAAGWLLPAIVQGVKAARAHRADVILSTAPPVTVHLVAAAVSALTGRPWVADFRDLWFGNPTSKNGPARTQIELLLEKAVLGRAAAITTVSDALAQRLGALHHRDVTVIPNAHDAAEWEGLPDGPPQSFELTYTGSMYDGARTPALLFEALAALAKQGDAAASARIHFYGPNSDHVGDLANRYGIDANVLQHGTVPRPQALAAQRAASNLLVFLNMDESTTHELGSKIFEYARARRPILVFGPRGSVARQYVQERSLGWFASNVEEATAALRAAYAGWKAGEYETSAPPDGYDARKLAQRFAAVLSSLLR